MNKVITKLVATSIISLLASSSYASIPYCNGTSVPPSKSKALQQVVTQYANDHKCKIGKSCILNFNVDYYSIAWSENCKGSFNDPHGSTFICADGICTPYGYGYPSATYND